MFCCFVLCSVPFVLSFHYITNEPNTAHNTNKTHEPLTFLSLSSLGIQVNENRTKKKLKEGKWKQKMNARLFSLCLFSFFSFRSFNFCFLPFLSLHFIIFYKRKQPKACLIKSERKKPCLCAQVNSSFHLKWKKEAKGRFTSIPLFPSFLLHLTKFIKIQE